MKKIGEKIKEDWLGEKSSYNLAPSTDKYDVVVFEDKKSQR